MAWPVYPHGFLGPGLDEDPYFVERSLRFDGTASLNRTFGTPFANSYEFSFSMWVKVSAFGTARHLFSVGTNHFLGFNATNNLTITFAGTSVLTTTAVFRDPSAWYHIVWRSLNATGSGQFLYVNNQLVGQGTGATSVNTLFNTAVAHRLGCSNTTTPANFFTGYMAEVIFYDEASLVLPSLYAEADPITSRWRPKQLDANDIFYLGFGTSFYLKFEDKTSLTTLGNSYTSANNWTLNNFSIAAGSGNDSLVESPSDYNGDSDSGLGEQVRGNYCTLNPINTLTTATLINGALDFTTATTGHNAIGTFAMSTGKWYWEARTTAGTTQARATVHSLTTPSNYYAFAANATDYGFRFDADAGTLDYTTDGINWVSLATGLTSGPYFPFFNNNGTTSKTISANFGQRVFTYTAPSGYKVLCTTNLPTPQVRRASNQIDSLAYAGDGTSKFLTASEFDVGLSWIKNRSAAGDHVVNDSFRNETSLLLNVGGADGSTTFTDSSTNSFPITNSNGVSVQTALGFNGAYFQGASSPSRALTLPTSNAFDFGALDWTIEFWYLKAGTPQASSRIFQTANGDLYTGVSISFSGTGDNLRCDLSADGSSWAISLTALMPTVSSSEWRHFAFVRNGTTLSAYQDGVLKNSGTITGGLYFSGDQLIVIGGQTSGTSRTVNGYIDNLRVVCGKALYTSAFTPPTRELGISASTSPSLSSNLSSNGSIGTSYIGPSADSTKVYVTSALNASSNNYINWRWRSGSSATRNTSGTIPSFAKANTTGGLSIVSWVGTGSAGTIGHELNATPAFIIAKQIGASTTGNAGAVYHKSLGATKYLKLFETTNGNAAETTDNTVWNGGSPTFSTTLFSVGTSTRTNNFTASPATYFPHIAYCFSEVPGFSSFGSYSGNALADGPFVFLGFRPEVLIIKPSSATGNWSIIDTVRDSVNVSSRAMFADTNALEDTTRAVDILSNGFKIRSATILNASAVTHVFAAFAESPFKYARAR